MPNELYEELQEGLWMAQTQKLEQTKEAVLPKSQQHLRCVRHQLPSRSSSRAAFQHPPEVAWWSCWLAAVKSRDGRMGHLGMMGSDRMSSLRKWKSEWLRATADCVTKEILSSGCGSGM